MPFIGQEPISGAFHKLDAITTSATATYNLQLNGGAYSPASANHLLVSLNGVIQAPQDSFTVSGSQITFDSALTSSDSIDFIMAYGDVLSVGVPTDGSVNTSQLANSAVTDAKIAGMAASKLTGAMPALDGSALTGMGMTLIGLYSPSSDVATMDITLSASAHDFYKIFGFLDNKTDQVNAYFRFLNSVGNSVGGGSDYHYSRIKAENSAIGITNDPQHGYIDWSATIGHSGSNETGIGFEMTVGPCNSTNFPVQMYGQAFMHDEGSHPSLNLFGGGYVSKKGGDGDFGGIRLYFGSGNVGSNSFVYVYGMNKT